jgi:hypothetical protein
MTTADSTDPASPRIVPPNVQLTADGVGHPPIDLLTLRRLSDRERSMPGGIERAKLRAKIAMYLPALLDLLDGTPLLPVDPPAPRLTELSPPLGGGGN